jgi:hypothetical protein
METKKPWPGIMTILSLEQVRDGCVIYREENVLNTLHFLGEQFLLNALFLGGNAPNTYIPNNYYLGLDNRTILAIGDTMESLQNEPFINGYSRQPVNSTTGFSMTVSGGVHQVSSQIVTFSAVGGSWGPCSNIFLSDKPNTTGVLISSAKLTNPVTVQSGDSVNMRMGMSLRYCPAS